LSSLSLSGFGTAVFVVLNPAELIKQTRDSTRLSDLNLLHRFLGLLNVDCPTCSFGSSSVVYVSIPDTSATCINLGLPTLTGFNSLAAGSTPSHISVAFCFVSFILPKSHSQETKLRNQLFVMFCNVMLVNTLDDR
jgi:hypothetical protein